MYFCDVLKIEHMNIQIKHLGPIRNAKIDLNHRLIVFCGPNSTGKTYASYAIYFLSKIKDNGFIPLSQGQIIELLREDTTSLDLDLDLLWQFEQQAFKALNEQLWRFFALPASKQNDYFSKTSIETIEDEKTFKERILNLSLSWEINLSNQQLCIEVSKAKDSLRLVLRISKKSFDQELLLKKVSLSKIYSYLIFNNIIPCAIFPVERSSIYTFKAELPKENPWNDVRYPLPIQKSLDLAQSIEQIQKQESPYFSFAETLENKLLKGKISISKDGNLEFNVDQHKGQALAFHQSSSIVKVLAALILHLKHLAKKNELIIIDEPEINLHPDNQILFARIIAQMIRQGLRVMISTHSDYILREINNLLRIGASKAARNKAAELGYQENEWLNAAETAVYLFNPKHPKSPRVQVEKITYQEQGFGIPSIDESIDRQNYISEELFFAKDDE